VSAVVAAHGDQVNDIAGRQYETVVTMFIPARFNGPPDSGNGGWSAGAFAVAAGARPGGPAYEVTLRVPPPLETPLSLVDGRVLAGETLVAEVTGADVAVVVPPVELPGAVAAARGYAGFDGHPFPTCYVCGPERGEDDGLRIFPGRLPDGRTAAPWTVPAGVSVETMWAALDCPGGWSVLAPDRVYLLGRIAVSVAALPAPGAACVVVGAAEAVEGRKATATSTVYAPDGAPLATARATWIRIRATPGEAGQTGPVIP
jgi:hypothetical protein